MGSLLCARRSSSGSAAQGPPEQAAAAAAPAAAPQPEEEEETFVGPIPSIGRYRPSTPSLTELQLLDIIDEGRARGASVAARKRAQAAQEELDSRPSCHGRHG